MEEILIKGKCIDYSYEGHGVVKDKDYGIIFVYGLFLNEEALIKLEYKRAGIFYGKVVKLLEKSPFRISPRCNVCSACGGCQFQQIDYSHELEFKRNKVKNAFKSIAKLDVEVDEVISMDEPYFYRNKIQMPIGLDFHNHIISGFYKEKTHKIIPIDKCYIENELASDILTKIKSLMKSMKITPYDEDKRTGIIRHVLIRTSYYFKEIMVTIVTNCDSFKSRNNFVKELIKECPNITTIVQNINERDTNVILGEKERILYGPGFIKDKLCDLTFKISSKSFYQTNPVQTEKLYSKVVEYSKVNKDDIVLDAYSGIGTIGLILAKNSKKVISVELVKEAHINAINNAKLNNINNFEAISYDATKFIEELSKNKEKIDVVIMDPPRKGSTPEFINAVLDLEPRRVVYVSCDPSTLARDVKLFTKKYQIERITPVDMFGRTFHVESVVSLIIK